MKIIVVHNYYQQPGGEDAAFAQERELLERAGHEVISYCRDNDEASGYSRFKQLGLLKQIIWANATQREIGSLLLRQGPPSFTSTTLSRWCPPLFMLRASTLGCPSSTHFIMMAYSGLQALFFATGKVCEECADHSLSRATEQAIRDFWGAHPRGDHRGSRTEFGLQGDFRTLR
jgi:hypothetical protein